MMQNCGSSSVKDIRTGRLLLSLRFSGHAAAVDYLSGAKLVCADCGTQFGVSSTITLIKRGNSWELIVPHTCEPAAVAAEQLNEIEARF
jgi:hypothetical protein